jgi:protein TonB
VTPVYPESERESGIEGVVVLEATIATDGTVSDTRVVTGPAGLREAAVAAVRQWQYEPYLLNGIPVETVTTITIEFNLRDPE